MICSKIVPNFKNAQYVVFLSAYNVQHIAIISKGDSIKN